MRRQKSNQTLTAGILCAAVLAAAISCRSPESGETAEAGMSGATPVKVFKARRVRISEKLMYTGTLDAWRKINVTPEVGGKIARILVDEGDRVVKGQVVAELETETVRLQLKQAEAAVAVALANFEDARRNRERMDRLVRENAVSEMQFEKIKLAHDAASAQLDQARAALNLAQHALDVSIMRAPFDAVVASRHAEAGDVINPMMGSFGTASGVMTLMDYSKIKVSVAVAPRDIGRIKKGLEAVLAVASSPGREFRGRVSVVNLTADPLSKKFGVEVVMENPDKTLRPGTFGDIVFEVGSSDDALVIPQKAVLENSFVFVVEGGRAVKRAVTLGLQNTSMIAVLSGLEDGARVIFDGNFGLEDGAPVEVLEEVTQ